jgi:hypothetical protein
MKTDYPGTRVFGYLGAVSTVYGKQNTFKEEGEIPENFSELWGRFHNHSGNLQATRTKSARIIQPGYKKIVGNQNGSNYEFIPAHVLRVEFPGGQTVRSGMWIQEDGTRSSMH